MSIVQCPKVCVGEATVRDAGGTRAVFRLSLPAVIAVLAFAFTAPMVVGQVSDSAIVDQNYPAGLASELPPEDTVRGFEFIRADLDGVGTQDYIVAAYYNGLHDRLRVLHVTGSSVAVYDPDFLPLIGGGQSSVRLVDVDGDGRPEVLLSTPMRPGSEEWILKWSSGHLSIISPYYLDHSGIAQTTVASGSLVDIDGDGRLELLQRAGTRDAPVTAVFRLVNGMYTAAPDAVFWTVVTRSASSDPDAFYPEITAEPGDYTLRIVNGGSNGAPAVTSGYLAVNDFEVPSSFFAGQQHTVTYDVTLTAENVVAIELRGPAGGTLTLSISKKQ